MGSPRSTRWWVLGGIVAGFLAWSYDYEFFLNAGGPEAPISTAIDRYSHLQDASFPLIALWPLAVFTVGGALLGLAVGWAVSRFKRGV